MAQATRENGYDGNKITGKWEKRYPSTLIRIFQLKVQLSYNRWQMWEFN